MAGVWSEERGDVLLSIKPEIMANIVNMTADHLYRNSDLPYSVERVFFYSSAPDQELRYVAQIAGGKAPGEARDSGGLGAA